MTIDCESLRPAFERWYIDWRGIGSARPILAKDRHGNYISEGQAFAWKGFCAAFESLGDPVAHASSERPNALVSAAQFGSALPKNRMEYSIPLYRLPEVLP